jgi:hypothetical protein
VEDTSSDSIGSEDLGDKSRTLWLLWYATKLREKISHMCGAWVQICGSPIGSEEEAPHGYALTKIQVVTYYHELQN